MTASRSSSKDIPLQRAFAQHPRQWRDFHYVYPVISRRAHGLSLGVNVNPDKACNFDCVYCQVERGSAPARRRVVREELRTELTRMLELVRTGDIWRDPSFAGVAEAYRRLNDIAFSGDGEPTTYRRLDEAMELAAAARDAAGLTSAKLVLVTNATGLHRPWAQRALAVMDRRGGEVWAKLDAGTEAYYRMIERTRVPWERVLENIRDCGRAREIVIQSMFLRWRGQAVPEAEFAAYLERLAELRREGCRIKLVQLYTVARRPADTGVAALTDAEMDALTQRLAARLPGLAVEAFYGVGSAA